MQSAAKDLNAIAALWLSVQRIHDTIEDLRAEAECIGRVIDALNADKFSTMDIEEAVAAINPY